MAGKSQRAVKAAKARAGRMESSGGNTSRSAAITRRGINTGADLVAVFSALIGDVIEGRITPNVANAACNVSGKLLKTVELQHKYGVKRSGVTSRVLELAPLAEGTIQ